MTPQERKLVSDLFDRLAKLESAPREQDAVEAINEGLDRAPNALYPMVQTVLVQDEALKRADARIRELEAALAKSEPQAPEQGGFLGSMRDSLIRRRDQQGSVPSVRAGDGQTRWNTGQVIGEQRQAAPAPLGQPSYGQPQQYGQPPQQQTSGGGSFLGTAAATVAGVVGGALLMNSFRHMFGGQQQSGQAHGALDQPGGSSAPWGSSTGAGDLARDAGLNDIGRGGGRNAAYDDASQRTGLFGSEQGTDDVNVEDADYDGGDFGGDFGGSDT